MLRPRWHDAIIIVSIVGLLAVGVWALWWDDVRAALDLGPADGSAMVPVPPSGGA